MTPASKVGKLKCFEGSNPSHTIARWEWPSDSFFQCIPPVGGLPKGHRSSPLRVGQNNKIKNKGSVMLLH